MNHQSFPCGQLLAANAVDFGHAIVRLSTMSRELRHLFKLDRAKMADESTREKNKIMKRFRPFNYTYEKSFPSSSFSTKSFSFVSLLDF